jgi:hypothetical protein
LILQEEIKRETDPLWSIKLKQQNLDVCKEFDEEIILEASVVVLVILQQYTMSLFVQHKGFSHVESIPLFFLVTMNC